MTTTTESSTSVPVKLAFDACGIKDLFDHFTKAPDDPGSAVFTELLANKEQFVAAVPKDLTATARSVIQFVETIVTAKPIDQKLAEAQPNNVKALREWSQSACK